MLVHASLKASFLLLSRTFCSLCRTLFVYLSLVPVFSILQGCKSDFKEAYLTRHHSIEVDCTDEACVV